MNSLMVPYAENGFPTDFGCDEIRNLKPEDMKSCHKICSTSNVAHCYQSTDSELFAFTLEMANDPGSKNIYLHHLNSLKTYPLTRSGDCSSPVIAAGL